MSNRGVERNLKNSPTVLVVCEKRDLSLAIVSKLINSGLYIVLVSKRYREFRKICDDKERLVIFRNIQDFKKKFSEIDYLIYFQNNSELLFQKEDITNQKANDFAFFKSLVEEYKSKSLFVFYGIKKEEYSQFYEVEIEKYLKEKKRDLGFVLYGDLGNLKSDEHTTYLDHVLGAVADERKVNVNPKQLFFPISPDDLAIQLVELLFSLKAYGKKTAILGNPLNVNVLLKTLNEVKNFVVIEESAPVFKFLTFDESIVIRRLSKKLVKELYLKITKKSLTSKKFRRLIKIRERLFTLKNLKLKKRHPSKLKVFLFTLLLLLLLPLFLMFSSFGFLLSARALLDKGFFDTSLDFASASVFFAKKSYEYSLMGSQIPITGVYFKSYLHPSSIMFNESETAKAGLEIMSSICQLTKSLTGKEDVDIEKFSQKLTFDLEGFYQKLGFLESEFSKDSFVTKLISLPLRGLDLPSVRKKVYLFKRVSEKLPEILGSKNSTKYAFLFQNSHFMRPTGGRIETFSVINFSSGKIMETFTEDVTFADKKLLGQIEPPEVLKKYFNQETWYLRDSNWDPDFIYSAPMAASFIDKELDLSLDGVVAVDGHFLSRIMTVLEKNSDDKLEQMLSTKYDEASYPTGVKEYPLTKFLKEIFGMPFHPNNRDIFRIVRDLSEGLENREVQIFIKDVEVNSILTELGWGGSFERKVCGRGCFSDFASLIESTLEGDSREISREVQFSIFFEEGIIKRKMIVFLENQGKDVYKEYLRFFANSEVGFSPITIRDLDESRNVKADLGSARDLKEAGIFLELPANESRALIINWEGVFPLKFNEKGEYRFSLRKQSGVDSYDAGVFVHFPENGIIFSEPSPSLTDAGVLRYNTSLTRDYNLRIFW